MKLTNKDWYIIMLVLFLVYLFGAITYNVELWMFNEWDIFFSIGTFIPTVLFGLLAIYFRDKK